MAGPANVGILAGHAVEIQSRITRAESLAAEGHLDEAIVEWREVLARVPALISVHLALGELHERKGDADSALAAYRALLERDPENTKARAAVERLTRR
jgi:tetratricopeptide (TPR) repeat protein